MVAVRHKIDGEQYAIKRVALPRNRDHGKLATEVTMLATLQHTNIVRYFGAWTELSDEYDDENQMESIELSSEKQFVVLGVELDLKSKKAVLLLRRKSSLKKTRFSNNDTV